MRQTTGTRKSPVEKLVKDIKRAARKQYWTCLALVPPHILT